MVQKVVRLQVIDDKIIRVESTNESLFKPKQSLIIVPQEMQKQILKVTENAGNVIVATSDIKALLLMRILVVLLLKIQRVKLFLQKVILAEKRFHRLLFRNVKLVLTVISLNLKSMVFHGMLCFLTVLPMRLSMDWVNISPRNLI